MKRILAFLFLAFFVSVLDCGKLRAQDTAQISGTVKDQSGAVLPGAEITATQTETGSMRTSISNETGSYVLPNLPLGPYRLEVSLPGFRTFAQTGIVLQVNSTIAINAVLEVGQVAETVEVQANAAMVETRSTGVGHVIENARILELPLIGRQVTDLIPLSGAAVPLATTDSNSRGVYPNTTGFSIAGGFLGGNTYTLDGAFHNDVYANYGLPLPFPDALQEFKVETSSLPAQYGFHSGGAINAVTKSGTNDWHGSLFEFVRNYKFNARDFFANTRDGLKRNQYGGTIGGPIQKNKLFVFGGYQGTITRQTPSSLRAFVPTPAMLSGDFTAIASPACNSGRPIMLRPPFVNNTIAPSRLSPAAVAIAKQLPAPVDECGLTNYGNPRHENEYFSIGKLDYQASSTHSMFLRYLGTAFRQLPPYEVSKNPLSTTTPGADDLLQSATYADTYLLNPNVINSFRATWNRTANHKLGSKSFGAADVGINIYQYVPKYTSVAVTGGFFSIGGLTGMPGKFATTVVSFTDDLSVVRGPHQMAFGASVMGFQSNTAGYAFTSGAITINGADTGHALADFMLGRVQSMQQGGPNKILARQRYFALYAQDSWKVVPTLTLSYGLRWEPYFPQQFAEDMMNHFEMDAFLKATKSTVFLNAPPGMFYPGDPLFGPNGTSGMYKQWKDFAPRFGLVWDPSKNGRMVIRAGYGIFYEQNTVELNLATGQGPPWGGKVTVVNPSGGLDNPYSDTPGGNPFPFVLNKNVPYSQYGVYDTFNANTRVPYSQQWNLGVQRQITNNWMVSASYIGNEVVHLYGARELNPAIYFPGNANATGQCVAQGYVFTTTPNAVCSTTTNTNNRRLLTLLNPTDGSKYGILDAWDDGGTRSYNGLLLSTEKRLSHGYSLGANYTWSHCIGNPTNTFLQAGAVAGSGLYIAPTRAGDRGNCTGGSGQDRRHIFNATGLIDSPHFSNNVLGVVASNWRLSTIVKVQSGSPFDIVTGSDDARTGINATTQRADQISPNVFGNKCYDDLRSTSTAKCLWLNRTAFANPAVGTIGNLTPGTGRGPGSFNIDAGLSRIFRVNEVQRVEFRAEATNILNHTNFLNPSGALNSANFGRPQSSAPARVFQFALKYVF